MGTPQYVLRIWEKQSSPDSWSSTIVRLFLYDLTLTQSELATLFSKGFSVTTEVCIWKLLIFHKNETILQYCNSVLIVPASNLNCIFFPSIWILVCTTGLGNWFYIFSFRIWCFWFIAVLPKTHCFLHWTLQQNDY